MANTRVFISYAFVDEHHPDYLFAQQLSEDLRRAGANVIVDAANMTERAFVEQLHKVLHNCQWLIVILTPEALRSPRVHMAVNTALNLIAKERMKGILAIIAAPCNVQEVLLTWDTLSVIDATQDYHRALARILIELNLFESINRSELQSKLPPLTQPYIDSLGSREDDRPLDMPRLPASLKYAANDRDRPQPLPAHSLGPRRSYRRWFPALLVIMAFAVVLASLGVFFTLYAKNGSPSAIDPTASIPNTRPGQTATSTTLTHSLTPSREPTPITGSSTASTPGPTATLGADPTPSPPQILTPTHTPVPILTLAVQWGSPSSSLWSGINLQRPVLVELRNNLNAPDIFQQTVITNSSGTATLQLTGVVPGVYVALLKPQGFLRQAEPSIKLIAGSNALSFSMTRSGTDCNTHQPNGLHLWIGDADGDNIVNNNDQNVITSNYTKASPASADLNGDGVININDLSLFLSALCNFGGGTGQVVGDG